MRPYLHKVVRVFFTKGAGRVHSYEILCIQKGKNVFNILKLYLCLQHVKYSKKCIFFLLLFSYMEHLKSHIFSDNLGWTKKVRVKWNFSFLLSCNDLFLSISVSNKLTFDTKESWESHFRQTTKERLITATEWEEHLNTKVASLI